jgi:hypothetical protein
LVPDYTKRLGADKGAKDVKRALWFKGVDWQDVVSLTVPPPWVPKVEADDDTQNYDILVPVPIEISEPTEA